ncbi:MAG: 4'-phosphopantetheinyl transferase superfamily protein [Lachnospira sp.]|nr:4'-phosphopantetheinyl transferase superfamily protein [Lachnospira sp.]
MANHLAYTHLYMFIVAEAMDFSWLIQGEYAAAYAFCDEDPNENAKERHARQHGHAFWLLQQMLISMDLWKEEVFGVPATSPLAIRAMEERMDRGVDGKPFFTGKAGNILFNITHTKGLVACVVSTTRDVGIDAECPREVSEAVILRVCSKEEQDAIRRAPRAFFKAWTYKEAYSKFLGEGFHAGFETLDSCHPPKCVDVMVYDVTDGTRDYVITICGGVL